MSKRRSHKWKSYVYCVSCNRPYLEAKKVVEEWDFERMTHKVVKKPSYGRHKYSEINHRCVNCGEQTWHNAVSLDKFKVASFVFIAVSAFLCPIAILTKEPLCWLLCCISILVTIYLCPHLSRSIKMQAHLRQLGHAARQRPLQLAGCT